MGKIPPVTGQIQIYKYAAEYNEVTGTAAGTPLKGAVYEIVNARSGKVVDYITTDARGVAASKPLPLTRYQIREVTAPAYWQLDPTVHDVTLEYPSQIIKLSAYDKPSSLGVSITKRGNAQVMAGQSMRYDLTVANTSNVPLESFFWHDKIPYDVARATTLTTGTYSARLNSPCPLQNQLQRELSGVGEQPAHQQQLQLQPQRHSHAGRRSGDRHLF